MSGLIYLDTSAAMKRVFMEDESIALRDAITMAIESGSRLITSALTLVEVSRGVRRRIDAEPPVRLRGSIETALGDTATVPIDQRIVESARIIGPPILRSLDAIHLVTALLVSASEVWTYDDRFAQAAEGMGIAARMPGRPLSARPS